VSRQVVIKRNKKKPNLLVESALDIVESALDNSDGQSVPSVHKHPVNTAGLYGFRSSSVLQFVVMLAVHSGLLRISAGGGLQSVGLSSSFLP